MQRLSNRKKNYCGLRKPEMMELELGLELELEDFRWWHFSARMDFFG